MGARCVDRLRWFANTMRHCPGARGMVLSTEYVGTVDNNKVVLIVDGIAGGSGLGRTRALKASKYFVQLPGTAPVGSRARQCKLDSSSPHVLLLWSCLVCQHPSKICPEADY